jgi:hypothetical protein
VWKLNPKEKAKIMYTEGKEPRGKSLHGIEKGNSVGCGVLDLNNKEV